MDGYEELSTLGFAQFPAALLLVCGGHNLSAPDWSAWCHACAQAAAAHHIRRLLVVTTGSGPNARQRAEVIAALMDRIGRDLDHLRMAVCGEDRVQRPVNMALAWLAGVKVRGFGYEERQAALDYLAVPQLQRAPILHTADRLATALQRRQMHAS